ASPISTSSGTIPRCVAKDIEHRVRVDHAQKNQLATRHIQDGKVVRLREPLYQVRTTARGIAASRAASLPQANVFRSVTQQRGFSAASKLRNFLNLLGI